MICLSVVIIFARLFCIVALIADVLVNYFLDICHSTVLGHPSCFCLYPKSVQTRISKIINLLLWSWPWRWVKVSHRWSESVGVKLINWNVFRLVRTVILIVALFLAIVSCKWFLLISDFSLDVLIGAIHIVRRGVELWSWVEGSPCSR